MMMIKRLSWFQLGYGFLFLLVPVVAAETQKVVDVQAYPVDDSLGNYVFSARVGAGDGR